MTDSGGRSGDSAIVRGFFNVVALGRSTVTIRRYHVSVWVLALIAVVAVVFPIILVQRAVVDEPEVMDGAFNVAVAAFDQVGDGASLSAEQLAAASDRVADVLTDTFAGTGVTVWSAERSGIENPSSDPDGLIERAGEIGADAVVTAVVTPDTVGSADIEFGVRAFGDPAERAAPPLTLNSVVGSQGSFDPRRPVSLDRHIDAVALDDVFDALLRIDNDEFWAAAELLATAAADHPEVELIRLLEGLTLLRWAAADVTRGQPSGERPAGNEYEPPADGLLPGARVALESVPPTDASQLFLLDVEYLDLQLPDRAEVVTPAEWSELLAGYRALVRSDDPLRESYVELMSGQIAANAALDGHLLDGVDPAASFARVIEIAEAEQSRLLDPFESSGWAGIGTVQLTADPADFAGAAESFRQARDLASPVFFIRYADPLALALIQSGEPCEADEVLADAAERAAQIDADLSDEHPDLVAWADAECDPDG